MRIVLSGGGTAGHILPNLVIAELARNCGGHELLYIGSHNGMEASLAQRSDIAFAAIPTGKLRRYFAWQNFVDFFRVPAGIFCALKLLRKFKPDVVFSKGGYVAVPVVIAAWLLRLPIVIHESDLVPGLATRLTMRLAHTVCLGWKESLELLPRTVQKKSVVTGHPIRPEVLHGDRKRGLALAGFRDTLPVVLVMGGSLGAQSMNALVRNALPRLTAHVQIIHLCGRGNVVKEATHYDHRYKQIDYADKELPHLYAAADLVVSRAGSGALAELTSLRKPMILMPLPRQQSRGDQIVNAQTLALKGAAVVLAGDLADTVIALLHDPRRRAALAARAYNPLHKDAAEKIFKMLKCI